MKELRFNRNLYSGRAIDATAKAFERHASCELSQTTAHFVVKLTAARSGAERKVAGAFANYALGLSIDNGGADTESSGAPAEPAGGAA